MNLTLSTLEILILLKCNKRSGLTSKTELSRSFRSRDIKEKEKAIKNLKEYNLILEQELPKPDSTKIPIFYKLTGKGKQWIDEYNKNYPD